MTGEEVFPDVAAVAQRYNRSVDFVEDWIASGQAKRLGVTFRDEQWTFNLSLQRQADGTILATKTAVMVNPLRFR